MFKALCHFGEQGCAVQLYACILIFGFYPGCMYSALLHMYIVTYFVLFLSIIDAFFLSTLFVAPEVLGPEKYDTSCDMWSIGVITYIL